MCAHQSRQDASHLPTHAAQCAALERRIAATDRQIDRLVYELYGLTKEEVGIVEGGGNLLVAVALY